MNDLLPYKHAEEGPNSTHYACKEMLKRSPKKVECCACSKHKCVKKYADKKFKLEEEAESY